jgi:Mlc titration factor MtfA (ptsG expression regulator)
VIRLLVTLMAAGMFAGAYAVLRGAVLRVLHQRAERPVMLPPAPSSWASLIERHVPLTRRLTSVQRGRLLEKVQQLVTGCRWEGCGGLALTDDMRVIIAAQACVLVLEHPDPPYPDLDTVLVYPGTFRPRRFSWTPSKDAADGDPTLGESWRHGVVVLAWDTTVAGAADPGDGQNVVMHEFAHQLDAASGSTDGVPRLPTASIAPWTAMLAHDFAQLEQEAARGEQGVLDHYGTTNPAEFFAVATEAFFERPSALRAERAELYAALREFYRQDPATQAAEVP